MLSSVYFIVWSYSCIHFQRRYVLCTYHQILQKWSRKWRWVCTSEGIRSPIFCTLTKFNHEGRYATNLSSIFPQFRFKRQLIDEMAYIISANQTSIFGTSCHRQECLVHHSPMSQIHRQLLIPRRHVTSYYSIQTCATSIMSSMIHLNSTFKKKSGYSSVYPTRFPLQNASKHGFPVELIRMHIGTQHKFYCVLLKFQNVPGFLTVGNYPSWMPSKLRQTKFRKWWLANVHALKYISRRGWERCIQNRWEVKLRCCGQMYSELNSGNYVARSEERLPSGIESD